jgi:hypothetical protein
MRAMEIDETRWPLLVHVYDGEQTDDDVTYYLRRLDEVHQKEQPFVTLTLIRRFARTFDHVSRLGAWMNANRARTTLLCKAGAIVAPSAAMRFMLSSFYLISSIDYPHLVCEDAATAEAWLVERIAAANLPRVT